MNVSEQFYVGYLVDGNCYKSFVKSYLVDVRDTLSDSGKSIYEKHNCYVDWVLTLLYFATGHRPVNDPFCYSRQISLEDGWCLVDDKAVEENRRYRMTPLSAISVKQLQDYYLHLQMLATRLSRNKEGESLAPLILSVLDDPDRPALPLFFYLNKKGQAVEAKGVGASAVHKKWRKYIETPGNEGRRFLASGLISSGSESELIRVLLGHEYGLRNHFDYLSRWSPKDAMEEISVEINKLQESCGFKTIPSFLRNKPKAKKLKTSNISQPFVLGQEQRKRAREKLVLAEKFLVRKLMNDIKAKQKVPWLSENNVRRFLDWVVSKAAEEKLSQSRCLSLAYQYLKKEKLSKEAGKIIRKRVPNAKPLGRIHESLVTEYRAFEKARETFLQILADGDLSKQSRSEKLAFVSVGAVLMDYLVTEQVFHQMAIELPESVYRVGDIVVCDFFLNESERSHFNPPLLRWVPSGFSRALLLQVFSGQASNSPIDTQKFSQTQRLILRKLFPGKKTASARENYLFRIAKSGLFINKPPLVRASYELSSGYTSLPCVAMERVVNGKSSDDFYYANTGKESFTLSDSIRDMPVGKSTRDNAKRLYKELEKIFSKVRNTPISANNRHKKQLKKVTRKEVLWLLENQSWTVAGRLLLEWLVELCDNGTCHKENLAFSTIYKYIFSIARPLLGQALSTDLLVMGAVDFERLYVQMVIYSKDDAFYLTGRMREFHRFCESKYSVPNLDWSSIYSEALSNKGIRTARKADANILSDMEYRAALSMLAENVNRKPLYDCQLGFCLIMGYRFGLRFDEVFSLQERQVLFKKEMTKMRVSLRTNSYGDGKSEAFNRNIPLLFELVELEKAILRRVFEYTEVQLRGGSRAVYLMAQEGESITLLNKQEVSKQLNRCLQRVTGDGAVRFHHLRHTWASSIGALALEEIEGKSSFFTDRFQQGKVVHKGKLRSLLGPGKPNIVGIYKVLGHANISTFIESYLHCSEYGQSVFELPRNKMLAHRALAQTLSLSDVALRKRYSRLNVESETIFPLTKREFKCFPELKIEKEISSFQGEPKDAEQGVANKKVSLVILNRVLVDYQWMGEDLTDYSARYGLKKEKIQTILEKAIKLKKRSGYGAYRLDGDRCKEKGRKTAFTNLTENKRLRHHLSSLDNSDNGKGLQPDQVLENFTELWVWGYCPEKSYFIMTEPEEIKTVREGLARLGIDDFLEIIVGNYDNKESLERLGLFDSVNAEIKVLSSFSRNRMKYGPSEKETAFGVRVLGLPSKIKTMRTFHRFMFLLSLYLKVSTFSYRD